MGLYIKLMRKTTALNLSLCSRPDIQISIFVRITVGNISNKDASLGLSRFEWRCSVLVVWSVCTHLAFFTKLCGVVIFQKFMEFL